MFPQTVIDINRLQEGDVLRLCPFNEDRIEQVRGDPVKVLRINTSEGMIRGALMGDNRWGRDRHTTWFAMYEFDKIIVGQALEPSWEV